MEAVEGLVCKLIDEDTVECNGTKYEAPEAPLSIQDTMFWVYVGVYIAMVLFAGLMSGLTIGLLSLDMMSLKVLKEGGTLKEQEQAKKIIPIVERHHLLLVTLLLANAIAVESMPLFLDRVSDPITAIVVSVTAVLLFGEVFPQALCSRFGLAIGATLAPLVYCLMFVFFIIAFPIAKLLDCLLGKDHSTFFRRAELKALVGLHGQDSNMEGGPLSLDEVLIIKGALEMREKTVENAMVSLDNVFMLSMTDKLDHETMQKILDASHSRIPVYHNNKQNIKGVLLVKTLINLDPDDAIPLSQLIKDSQKCRPATYVHDTVPLFDILNEFQTGKSHLCMVCTQDFHSTGSWNIDGDHLVKTVSMEKPDGMIVGVITLEDVIEELLQEEIIDETDVFVDVQQRIRVAQSKAARKQSLHPDAIRAMERNLSQANIGNSSRGIERQASTSSRGMERQNSASRVMDKRDTDDPTAPLLP